MSLNSISELNEEDIMLMYNDIAEFGDTSIADCCCRTGSYYFKKGMGCWYKERCEDWCRQSGSTTVCNGWSCLRGSCGGSC